MLQRTLALAAVVVSVAACGSSSSTESAHVRGTVSGLSTQNGRAVAITSQGKTFWTDIKANGSFDLTVPSGASLRVFFASAPAAGPHPVDGHLVGADGSRWIAVTSGTTNLGVVRPVAAATGTGGIATRAEHAETDGEDSDGEDGEDDTREDDGEKEHLCGADGATDVEVRAESAPTPSKDTDDHAEKEREDEASRKACGN